MKPYKTQLDERGRAKLHADIAHPINQACRDLIQKKVLESFGSEVEKSKQAGYKPSRDLYPDAGPEGPDEEIGDEETPEGGSRSQSHESPKKKAEGKTEGKAESRDEGKDEGASSMGIFS